jgi:hypothetical protein
MRKADFTESFVRRGAALSGNLVPETVTGKFAVYARGVAGEGPQADLDLAGNRFLGKKWPRGRGHLVDLKFRTAH